MICFAAVPVVVDGHFKISTCILCDHRRYVDEKAYVDGGDRGIYCNDPFIWPFTGCGDPRDHKRSHSQSHH